LKEATLLRQLSGALDKQLGFTDLTGNLALPVDIVFPQILSM
jgi:hypothetical protein